MERVTQAAMQIRERILREAIDEHGRAAVEGWADDPVKRGLINALAQLEADSRRRPPSPAMQRLASEAEARRRDER